MRLSSARRAGAALMALAVVTSACSGTKAAGDAATPTSTLPEAPEATADATFRAFGSVGQVTVTGASPSAELLVVDRRDRIVGRGTADAGGSLVVYDVAPGTGYSVRTEAGGEVLGTKSFEVLDGEDAPPSTQYTDQRLVPGLNYVKMRDGIELAVTVRLPPGASFDGGATYPTVIEYSGYAVAPPHDLLPVLAAKVTNPDAKDDPLAPSSATAVGSVLAPAMGFVAVSVQMRGSGCSGGAFDLFGLPTIYDGYDIVETVAAQPWVKGGKVGMVGISYSGISQLFVSGTRPPHLAAIAPMSPTDDLYYGVGFPGGIFNNGFAKTWLTEREHDAKPAPDGQDWAKLLVEQGDERCAANQLLHSQARDGLQILSNTEFRDPILFQDRSPGEWLARSEVPMFLVGAMQDEQVSSHWATLMPSLSDRPDTWVTAYSGRHADAVSPRVVARWLEFLQLFVADEVPHQPGILRSLGGPLFEEAANAKTEPLPADRFEGVADRDAALATFRQDPKFRVLLDVGASELGPGSIRPTWELTADQWPPSSTEVQRWYLADGGQLVADAPEDEGTDTYTADPDARPQTNQSGDAPKPAFPSLPNDWRPLPDGSGLGYVTAPLERDVVMAGTASADLQISATAKDTDLQVTITEVRPDGQETFVGSGWLRASHRKLDRKRSTETFPVPTHLAEDAEPLPSGRVTLARVATFPVVYAFRAGSRLRITVSAPGGDLPDWKFQSIDDGTTEVSVHRGGDVASSFALPVVADQQAGAPLPACNTLRGQPCRAYRAASNGG